MHGHPWARILNEKFEKRKPQSQIQKLRARIFRKESDQEKYFAQFFNSLNKQDLELKSVNVNNIAENNLDPIANDIFTQEQSAV